MNRKKLFTILYWFTILSLIGTLMHVDLIDSKYYTEQLQLHHEIVTHSAPSPYQYRVLQPMLVEFLLNISKVEAGTNTYRSFFLTYYAYIRFLAIFITFIAVFFSLKLTWPGGTAVLATTILAVFIPFTYRYYYYQPTSILEMTFFGLGLYATLRRIPWALLPLVAIGTLNRETMCFIPVAYFLFWLPELRKKEWIWLVISIFAWILVFRGLRVIWPATSDLFDITLYIPSNLKLSRGTLDILVILSPAILVIFNLKRIPERYLRLALCSIPWMLLHFCTSLWHEIRYYMPVLIWLLPCLVITICGKGHHQNIEMENGSLANANE